MSKKIKISQVVTVIPGMSFCSRHKESGGKIPMVSASAIRNLTILDNFDNLPTIKELPTRSPAIIENDDVLLVSRTVPGGHFKSALIHTTTPVVATSSLCILRIKDPSLTPTYLNHYLNSDIFQREALARSRGSTITHLARNKLEEIPIAIPSLKQQETIVNLHHNLEHQDNVRHRTHILQQQILQQLFTNLQHA